MANAAVDGGGNGAPTDVKTPAPIPEFLPTIINCKEEQQSAIRAFAEREKIALLAFIAPQVGVRVSPADVVSASIGLLEEFGVGVTGSRSSVHLV